MNSPGRKSCAAFRDGLWNAAEKRFCDPPGDAADGIAVTPQGDGFADGIFVAL